VACANEEIAHAHTSTAANRTAAIVRIEASFVGAERGMLVTGAFYTGGDGWPPVIYAPRSRLWPAALKAGKTVSPRVIVSAAFFRITK
jgi:hypothetical protein